MEKFSELKAILSKELNWHKSRIDCLFQMLIALISVRTVNLQELAVAMTSKKSLVKSRKKRLYRFFAKFNLNYDVIALWIISLFFADNRKFYIAIDRTNWLWGKAPINIFMASICYEGIAIPLLWTVLDKDGSSSAKEQIALVTRIKTLLGLDRIEGLLADREFGNKEFIQYLNEGNIPFYIRIKEDNLVYVNRKKFKKAGELFPNLKRYSPEVFGMRVEIFGGKFYLTASKNERDELMIVITNKNYKQAINIYLRRWEIECLFQALKGRGFNFEDTRIINPLRIEKMIAVLAIAFVAAHKTGEWQNSIRPIRLKKLKNFLKIEMRPEYSFFRYGLDVIRDAITGLTVNWKILKTVFKFLEKPPLEAKL